ncbi:MAG: hypothetical protein M1320_00445 [Patescibacteria group bacterium]|nr:hypothetical protein [Patescibacteria group bacterium]
MNKPYSKTTKTILVFLLISGSLVIASSVAPRMASELWRVVFKKLKPAKKDLEATRRLVKTKYIKIIREKDEVHITLTTQGKKIAREISHDANYIKTKKWDKKWRVIMYDIPSKHKHERDALRQKVKELGMHQLQKSVWIYPYDCKEEIQFLCDMLNVSYKKHILYFETEEVPEMNELKNIFALR